MRPVSAMISIDAPRERVHDLVRDLSVRPAFTDHFVDGFRLGRVEPAGVGASARFRLSDSGVWMDTVVEADDAPHLLREHGRGGRGNRVEVFTVWELAPGAGPQTCEATVTFWTEPASIVDRARELLVSKRALRRGWGRALRRLRDLAESGGAPEHVAIGGGDRVAHFVS
jgi:hypothetical protein